LEALAMTIKIIAQACLALAIGVISSIAIAAPDVLLENIRNTYKEKGAEQATAMARGLGVLTRTENKQLMIPVILDRNDKRGKDFAARLAQAGARIDARSRSYTRLLVPVSQLDTLFNLFPDERLSAPIPAFPAFGLGSIVSESVALTGADGYQVGNLDGTGAKVAVVDLGFAGLANAIDVGELPANTVSVDFTGGGIEGGGKHGVGVAEHVADMAPGAQLYCLRIADQTDLQNAGDYIRDNGIQIANHSVGWVIASYYDDTGTINGIINDSYDNDGVFWVVSSGNFASKHWRGGWLDGDGDDLLEFSGTDELLELKGTSGTISVFLNWNQYGQSTKTTLDLYVRDVNGNTAASSTITQSRFNDPAEAVSFTYDSNVAPYSVVVVLANGSTTDLDITLFSFNHNFEYAIKPSSVADPASAHGAFTVGAIDQAKWNNTNPPIRGYSSQGYTNDGRLKPDLVAPDGTSSLTYATASGTSFSSPTTAGAAALLLQEDNTRTAIDLGDTLRAQAIDVGATGADGVFGYGKLQLPLIDSDGDLLTNVEEIALGTDALDSDSDGDGLDDYQEVQTYSTDPLSDDTDSDGVNDYDEVIVWGSDPLVSGRGDLGPYGSPDNLINLADYLILSRMVVGDITPTSAEVIYGDLNNNGGLDAGDLVLMQRVIQGEIPLP
jgi:subtilisin family serine protease